MAASSESAKASALDNADLRSAILVATSAALATVPSLWISSNENACEYSCPARATNTDKCSAPRAKCHSCATSYRRVFGFHSRMAST